MARIRTIKPAFFTSQDVVSCCPLARLLFIGLWCEADKRGRLYDKPGQLKMRVLPNDDADVDALLWELHDATLIQRVALPDGQSAIYITTFDDHQKPHPKEPESTIPDSGRGKTRQAVEKHGEVFMHPVENPSTTARKGREGDLGREGKGMENGRGGGLVLSAVDYEKLTRHHAYVGARLRVPKKLHADFMAALGGTDTDTRLRAWYAGVDAEIEASGEAIVPDIWKWMEARFKAFTAAEVAGAKAQRDERARAEERERLAIRRARADAEEAAYQARLKAGQA